MEHFSSPPRTRGFTLIEVLCVIAVVAILAALLLPVTAKMSKKANATKCLSNLRQVGVAATLYRTESDGYFPRAFDVNAAPGVPRSTWIEKLIPYLNAKEKDQVNPKSVFNCPSRKPLSGQTQWWKDGMSFGMNTQIENPNWGYRFSAVPEASKIILFGEIVETNTEWLKSSDNQPKWGAAMGFRHAPNQSNMLFCDGHVEAKKREELVFTPVASPSLWKWW